MNSDWTELPLGDLVTHKKGFAFKSQDFSRDGGRRVIRVSDTNATSIKTEDPIYLSEQKAKNYADYELSHGDIILTTVGSRPPLYDSMVGKTIRVPKEIEGALLNQNMVRLSPKAGLVDPGFLYSVLKTRRFISHIEGSARGNANQASITLEDTFQFPVLVPSLSEQRKIADILSCWDDAIKKYEQLIDRTAFSFRRLIKEFLGDGRTKRAGLIDVAVDDCCDILDTKRKPLNKEQRNDEQGKIPYYGANGKVGAVDEWIFDESLILIAEDGGYFDEYKTRPIAYRINGKSWVNNHAHILKAKPQFDQNCIFFCLVHKDISAFLNGGTRAKLNRKELEKIVIQLPSSLEKQQLVGSTLDSICTEINLLGSILDRLHQEKLALMQNLLTGKIRVKV